MLEAMDKRLNTVNELLQNIRFLKFYGWGRFFHLLYCPVLLLICPENYWSSRAQGARSDELLWRIRAYVIEVVVGFIWSDIFTLPRNQLEPHYRIWIPSATALVAFLCYTLIEGQKLTVSKAFTALALFSYLQGPMATLPGQIQALLTGVVADGTTWNSVHVIHSPRIYATN